jgi:hypothetical protein
MDSEEKKKISLSNRKSGWTQLVFYVTLHNFLDSLIFILFFLPKLGVTGAVAIPVIKPHL